MAISVMGQKGLPPRNILTAEQIFEMQKVERSWVMIKSIFEVFAMHDVMVLKPKIMAWLSSIISYYNPTRAQYQQLPLNMKTKEFYQYCQTGVPLFYIMHLYIKDPKFAPDSSTLYEHPQSRQECLTNLQAML